jgi:hypothetical protein
MSLIFPDSASYNKNESGACQTLYKKVTPKKQIYRTMQNKYFNLKK